MRIYYSLLVKQQAIELHHKGYSSKYIGDQLGIDRRYISRLINRYLHMGEDGLKRQPTTPTTPEFKQEIVEIVLKKCISCEQVALQYGIGETAILSWVRQVKSKGYDSLFVVKPRGRPPKGMGRPKKREPKTELEKLQERVAYLEAENALLKKVKALVEAKDAQLLATGHKPSKN